MLVTVASATRNLQALSGGMVAKQHLNLLVADRSATLKGSGFFFFDPWVDTTHIHTYIYTPMYIHTDIHTSIYMYIHIYIHIYIH